MDALIADVAIAGVPEPMPVVMHQVAVERLFRRGAKPEIEIDRCRRHFDRLHADAPPRLAAIAFRDEEFAILARMHRRNLVRLPAATAVLRAMLDHPLIFLGGFHTLAAFKDVVADRLFDVHILARLAGPDRHQRMPMVGRGDRDDIQRLVVERFAHVLHTIRSFVRARRLFH
jgi:hypothetical protein